MPFINEKGKLLSKEDALALRSMYESMLNGYHADMQESARFARNPNFYPPVIAQFQTSKEAFLANFDRVQKQGEIVSTDDFYRNGLRNLYNSLLEKMNVKDAAYSNFESNYGEHFLAKINGTLKEKDTKEGFQKSIESFSLTNQPFPGVDQIASYNPNSDSADALSEVRKGNSNTYEAAETYENGGNMNPAMAGYGAALSVSKSIAALLMGKREVTTNDLFDAFKSFNKLLRPNDPSGGTIRGVEVSYGHDDEGVLPVTIPENLFNTFRMVAENINKTKNTPDPVLQKSRAIQVASFSYQMLVSIHAFQDGNGRSCRMFADTILQSFGLPPHTPNLGLMATGGTIGKKFDFKKGADLFLDGIKVSDELLKLDKEAKIVGIEEQAKDYLDSANMSRDLLKTVSPKKAISLAVSQRENIFSFMESLSDFTKADHIFTWNSDQYKNMKTQAKALLDCLVTNPINSKTAKDAMKAMNDSIKAYEDHCKRHPKNNDRRMKRLDSAFKMGRSLFYIENQANQLTKIEAKIAIKETKQALLNNLHNPEQFKQAVAEYMVIKQLEQDMRHESFNKSIDEVKPLLAKNNPAAKAFMDAPYFNGCLQKASELPGFAEMSKTEQLEAFDKSFKELKRADLLAKREAARARKAAEQQGKQEEKNQISLT